MSNDDPARRAAKEIFDFLLEHPGTPPGKGLLESILRTAFAEALEDTERLDWAEECLMIVERHMDVLPETPVEIMHSGASGGGIRCGYPAFGKTLRAAIDAARKQDE